MPAPPRKLGRDSFFAAADERLAYAREQQGGFVFFDAPAGVALENVAELSDLQLGIVAPASEFEGPAGPTIVSLGTDDGHEEWLLPPLAELRASSAFTASRAGEHGQLVTLEASLELEEEMARLQIGDRVHVAPAMVWLTALGDWEEQTVRTATKDGRNEPCPCGSGAKFKRCCGA